MKYLGGSIILDPGMLLERFWLIRCGRPLNARILRWLPLGNQLGSDMIHEPELAERLHIRWVFNLDFPPKVGFIAYSFVF